MSRRSYQKTTRRGKQPGRAAAKLADISVQLPLCRDELVQLMQGSLERFATQMGYC